MARDLANRFFLYGYYGQENLGDDLLLFSTITGICEICPGAGFMVRSGGPIRGLDKIEASVEPVNVDNILADQSKGKVRRAVETLLAYRRCFRKCSWLIFGGGTVFHERKSVAPLVLLALICLLARLMGLKVAALGVGVAELKSPLGRFALRVIVMTSELFAVRDNLAYAECEKACSGQRVMLTGDLVFGLKPQLHLGARDAIPPPVSPARHVALSINPWLLHDVAESQKQFEILAEAVSILAGRGWSVSLLAFHNADDGASDHNLLDVIRTSIPADRKSLVREFVLAPDADTLTDVFSSIDVHCGMRFHGHVLAAMYEKRFVGISADNKIDAICRLFGMPVLPLGAFDADGLIDAIDSALGLKIDTKVLEMSVLNARRNFTALSSFVSPADDHADAQSV